MQSLNLALIITITGLPYHLSENYVYVSNNKSHNFLQGSISEFTLAMACKKTEEITFTLLPFLFSFNLFCSIKILI